MIEETEDCGCDTGPTKKLEPEDIDFIKDKMSETKDKLESIMDTFKGFNFSTEKFDKMESEIEKISDFIQSGEFLGSLEKMFESGINKSSPNSEAYKEYFNKKQDYMDRMVGGINPAHMDFMKNMMNTTEPKSKPPIGYVYIDENGEQRFSPTKPEGISSTAVYGE